MTKRKGVTQARLFTILKRQAEPRWGADYIPAILATPQEAPSISHACTLNSTKLGREVHCLSLPEAAAALLALYHPGLVELHEQRMLAPWPTMHPLIGFPGPRGHEHDLPALRGIIDVADRLGYVDILPRVRVTNLDAADGSEIQVFPYIGDFLLFLRSESGGIYCVNWSIKDQDAAFKRTSGRVRRKTMGAMQDSIRLLARHEIEDLYYRDAGIRTVRIAGENIDFQVVANLKQLFFYNRSALSISHVQQAEILDKYRMAMDLGIPPLEVALDLCSRGTLTAYDCRTVLYQSIWRRDLPVDLFKPILINKPLSREQNDVLVVYGDWFRGA